MSTDRGILVPHNPVHMASPPHMAWTTTNVSEAVPGVPTPLAWDVFERGCERGARLSSQQIGLFSQADVDDPDPLRRMFGVFYGRPVISIDRTRWIGDGTPGMTADDMERSFFGQVREGTTSSPTRKGYPAMAVRAPITYLRLHRHQTPRHRGRTVTHDRYSSHD